MFKRLLLGVVFLFLGVSCDWFDDGQDDRLEPTIILISLDGFRWDYLDRTDTPNLDQLASRGVRAKALIPVFPSRTFPNHLTIVTGLYPENHGIVSNRMYDEEFDTWYYIGEGAEPVQESRWYEGEPIWVTAEKQGQITATFFWPGSEAEINGYRPTYWNVYDGSVPNVERVDQVLAWLDFPDDSRPTFITLYFSDTDSWGHYYGPEAAEMETAIQNLDGYIGRLIDGLEERDLLDEVNIMVTSDHGMASTSRERVVFIDDYIDLDDALMVEWTPVAMILPEPGQEDSILTALQNAHPQLAVYQKSAIPDRWHYRNHRRITPLIAVAAEGWSIGSHYFFDEYPSAYSGGSHGYDPALASMRGIFIAAGPAFKKGLALDPFQNLHLYSLMCQVLGLEPSENDGDLDSVRVLLAQ